MDWLIGLGVIFIIYLLYKLNQYSTEREELRRNNFKKDQEVRVIKDNLAREMMKVDHERLALEKQRKLDNEALENIFKEKSIGFPWLAKAYGEYMDIRDKKLEGYLVHKKHPAQKAADVVKDFRIKNKKLTEQNKILDYIVTYYEELFPWITEFKEQGIDEIIEKSEEEEYDEENYDRAKQYLSEAEYRNLSNTEKYQRALDRYLNSRKNQWQIGRDYERYIGYLYEQNGYRVYYQGILEGYSDLGRDLICIKNNTIEIVQCKYWAKHKTIHEKHINQLYGTTIMYQIQHDEKLKKDNNNYLKIKPVFITSTKLSDIARKFANILGVEVIEELPLEKYPLIKCNISTKDGTRIFHLPFDQQYDKVQIAYEGECYVNKIYEAEALGFRRAYRWKGN